MSTDLVKAGSQAMTTVEDVTENVQLIAEHPADMQAAQSSLAEWFRQKIEIAKGDASDAEDSLDIATKAGWKATSFERQKRNARKRVVFYEKCLAAIEAGYTIIPNFPVDVFAIRTKRETPKRAESQYPNSPAFVQKAQEAPHGEGEYVDPFPVVGGSMSSDVAKYFPRHFDEIEFPISIAKPRVLEATQRAMAAKIFDEVGCLPVRNNKKGDPIVTGAVLMRNGYTEHRIMFLIAWWIDTRQLP